MIQSRHYIFSHSTIGPNMPLNLLKISGLVIATLSLMACGNSGITENYINHSERTSSFIERDQYRHPEQTLAFFDINEQQTVVEIWPGSGWYTEILAPYLKDNGKYYAAHFPEESNIAYFTRMRNQFDKKLALSDALYEAVITTDFRPPHGTDIAPPASVDRVLTFRNVHNWMKNESEQAAFDSFYKALKPGAILGVVEHRAPDIFTVEDMIKSGYVSEAYVKELAKNSGFIFDASSEINANPQDTKSHPKGVWTLPPSLRLGEVDKSKYLNIGESDRMTLRFKKPLK